MSLTAAAVALMIGSALPEGATLPESDSSQAVSAAVSDPVSAATQADTGKASGEASSETSSETSPASGDVAPQAVQDQGGADITVTVPSVTGSETAQPLEEDEAQGSGNEIIVTRRRRHPPGDPLENINETSFVAVQAIDKAVLEPVAKAYNKGLPRPVRQGLRNLFSNLREPVVAVAFLLEFKPGKAAETVGRFAINTTLGIAGLVDVAKRKPFHLPYRANGLSDVLGYYGVGPGPFMYLPIIGPTTLRDLIGDTVDNLASPALLGKPFNKPEVLLGMTVVDQLGERAAFDDEIGRIREDGDPYTTYRELYLRQRKAEIEALHGRILPDVVPVYGPGMRTPDGKAGEPATESTEQPAAAAPEATVPEAAAPEAAPAASETVPGDAAPSQTAPSEVPSQADLAPLS